MLPEGYMGHSILRELKRCSAQRMVLWHMRNARDGHHLSDELQWHTVQSEDQSGAIGNYT